MLQKCLTVLLFHNDEDIISDQIEYYGIKNKQDLIVFNHNSNDNTGNIITSHQKHILCTYNLSSNIQFNDNKVHEAIYLTLQGNLEICNDDIVLSDAKYNNFDYSKAYDWISFPESDEFLEGPDRTKSYYEHLCSIHLKTKINKIIFRNIIFWFTSEDDKTILRPIRRIKHYCYKSNCAPRLYAWRGSKTIIRRFGHMTHLYDKNSECLTWNTRHYEIRSKNHFINKMKDRLHISKGTTNHHYKIMYENLLTNKDYGTINPNDLHYDNGISELCLTEVFDWNKIY